MAVKIVEWVSAMLTIEDLMETVVTLSNWLHHMHFMLQKQAANGSQKLHQKCHTFCAIMSRRT